MLCVMHTLNQSHCDLLKQCSAFNGSKWHREAVTVLLYLYEFCLNYEECNINVRFKKNERCEKISLEVKFIQITFQIHKINSFPVTANYKRQRKQRVHQCSSSHLSIISFCESDKAFNLNLITKGRRSGMYFCVCVCVFFFKIRLHVTLSKYENIHKNILSKSILLTL